LDRDEVEFVRQCDEEDMLAAADSIAAAFDVQVDEREGWHKSYGDRYQFLKSRFEIDKAGLFYQREPFMGQDLCFVIAPIYTLDSELVNFSVTPTEGGRKWACDRRGGQMICSA
jgi:hypothetical protein